MGRFSNRIARLVSEDDIRNVFDRMREHYDLRGIELQYWEDEVRAVKKPFLPKNSVEVIDYVYDRDRMLVAVVHYYRRPDGSIGASGMKDPKYVYFEGVEYRCL